MPYEIGRYLKNLNSVGMPIGILANSDVISKNIFYREAQDIKFQVGIFSCDEGCLKPFPEIFLRAKEHILTVPRNILFLDDRAENINAARSLGMKCVQCNYKSLVSSCHSALKQTEG